MRKLTKTEIASKKITFSSDPKKYCEKSFRPSEKKLPTSKYHATDNQKNVFIEKIEERE